MAKIDSNSARKFGILIAALGASFGRQVDEATLTAFEIGLSDLPLEKITAAVQAAIRSCRFMPSPAELRELAGVVSPQHRAVVAWTAFSAAVSKHGFYKSVDFDDPVVNAVVRSLGGWLRVSSIDDSKEFEVFLRRDFERTYLALYAAGISAEQAAPLVGHLQAQNELHGYAGREFNGVAINQLVRIATGLPSSTCRITATAATGQPLGIAVAKSADNIDEVARA